jgi:hypothetical protein
MLAYLCSRRDASPFEFTLSKHPPANEQGKVVDEAEMTRALLNA